MRPFTRIVAAAALAVSLAVTVAPTVGASEVEFTWLGCEGQPGPTTGDLSGYNAGTFAGEAWHGSVFGSLFPCRTPAATDVFAIASYDNNGSATAIATFYGELETYLADVDVRLKTAAVCLIDKYDSRLDCIKISWLEPPSGPARPLDGGHLPVDSPLVAATPVVTLNGMVIDPGCPTCVEG